MKNLLKFLKNLFKRKDEIKVKVNRENGTMEIVTTRELTQQEIIDLVRKNL